MRALSIELYPLFIESPSLSATAALGKEGLVELFEYCALAESTRVVEKHIEALVGRVEHGKRFFALKSYAVRVRAFKSLAGRFAFSPCRLLIGAAVVHASFS